MPITIRFRHPVPRRRFAVVMAFVAFAGVLVCLGRASRGLAQELPDPVLVPSAIAQFTTGIENREPIDQVTFVRNGIAIIYLFSDLRGLAGQTVAHRWSYRGQTMAEVHFAVGGPRWRVWSSKELDPSWLGEWTVEIVAEDDEVIAVESFSYLGEEDSKRGAEAQ